MSDFLSGSKPCKEIFKLKHMLEKADIPFEFIKNFGYEDISAELLSFIEHYQICYPSRENMKISVIEGLGTFGREQDRLEILGGFTPWERFKYGNSPMGYLTVKNVFKRIKRDWDETTDREGWI